MKRILRVFPRKTRATPEDSMAFVGEPLLFRPEADEVHISCSFTWDMINLEKIREMWEEIERKKPPKLMPEVDVMLIPTSFYGRFVEMLKPDDTGGGPPEVRRVLGYELWCGIPVLKIGDGELLDEIIKYLEQKKRVLTYHPKKREFYVLGPGMKNIIRGRWKI